MGRKIIAAALAAAALAAAAALSSAGPAGHGAIWYHGRPSAAAARG